LREGKPIDGWLDRRAARRWFARAGRAGATDPVAEEVERRMVPRLEYVRLDPRLIADVGAAATAWASPLHDRYPKARVLRVEAAFAPVRARGAQPLAARVRSLVGAAREYRVCADPGALPIRTGSCGLVWSNLALAWSADPAATLREWHRVLEIGGLLMFSSYGPDTLKELRAAFAAADPDAPHVHPFVDMHDLGDALVAVGFADPVMDMELLTVTYASADALLDELRSTGRRNALAARRRSLTGRRAWARMVAGYHALARDGRVPASFEIVYGHAWKLAPRTTADGRAIIQFDRPGKTRKTD
jgi:malonyl-CoA O-methyltransferase